MMGEGANAMEKPAIILYNFTRSEAEVWKKQTPLIQVISVPKTSYGLSARELLEGKKAAAPEAGTDFSRRILLLAGIPDPMVHFLLDICKRVTREPVLRAVLTETNRDWSAGELYRNLQEEEETLRRLKRQ